ncbi:hypothetical protein RBB50_012824 [Rhinocladiella similis]
MQSLSAHVSESPTDGHPDTPPSKKRKKGSTATRKSACQPCRMRKVKCDRVRPVCYICKSAGTECHYLSEESNDLTLEVATERVLDRLEKLQTDLDSLARTTHDQATRTLSTSSQRLVQGADFSPLEPSRDFLQIPPHRTSADSVLCWEIFENRYGPNALIGALFPSDQTTINREEDVFAPSAPFKPVPEERIPYLIDNFLQNVHTKNPVLNVERLVKEGRKAAQQGLGWDAWSCLVLLACALGSVAKPFAIADALSPGAGFEAVRTDLRGSSFVFARELEDGESYFLLASRRLGTLKHTLQGAQCHFLAGVYLMYTLRPLLSWQYFYHASILFQLHLKTIHGIHGAAGMLEIPAEHLNSMDRKRRRLEQSLYWSCFKSECEFRVELPLPQSEIGSFRHPNLFPSPPSPATPVMVEHNMSPQSAVLSSYSGSDSRRTLSTGLPTDPRLEEELFLKQQSKRLCREEESWYYYLTEIALRRIGNRIINTFFRQDRTSWLNVRPLLRIAQEFDVQISSWSAHMPPAMKHYEATSTIKAPMLNAQVEDCGNSVSRELSWATENRILEMRSWLYQPFLYYLIHYHSISSPPVTSGNIYDLALSDSDNRANIDTLLNPTTENISPVVASSTIPIESLATAAALDNDETTILRHMITSGIECNLKVLDVRSLQHRHHGLWYDLRSLMCASLILLGVVKSGHAEMIPGGPNALWGTFADAGDTSVPLAMRGKIGHVLSQFEFWSNECPECC